METARRRPSTRVSKVLKQARNSMHNLIVKQELCERDLGYRY